MSQVTPLEQVIDWVAEDLTNGYKNKLIVDAVAQLQQLQERQAKLLEAAKWALGRAQQLHQTCGDEFLYCGDCQSRGEPEQIYSFPHYNDCPWARAAAAIAEETRK